jgi:GWxTD domain-containing protein
MFARACHYAVAVLFSLVGATSAKTQISEPLRRIEDPACIRADSLVAIGKSASAVASLDSALHNSPGRAEHWFCYGLLHWRLAANMPKAASRDARTLGHLRAADSAFRLATQHAPDSAQYWVTLAQFGLRSDVSSARSAVLGQIENAVKAASKLKDSLLLGIASDELGMAIWRRHQQIANRALTKDGAHVQLSTNARWRRDRGTDYIATFATLIDPPTGESEYKAAFEHFTTAVTVSPTTSRYSRHLFMVLIERRRWAELLRLASDRAERFAFDPQARLAVGLSQHRLGRNALARAAYDSGLALMDDDDRTRLLRLTRILRPRPTGVTVAGIGDSVGFQRLSDPQKRAVEALYWTLNDPLVGTEENEYQLEFLSRVTSAEFSWSDENTGVHGVDTDRGDVFVRFGPPDVVMTVAGSSSVQQAVDAAGVMRMSTNENGGATLIWSYNVGQTFFFDLSPAFGTARIPTTDLQFVSDVKDMSPVSWTNLGLLSRIDTMDVRVTRFRAGKDSTEIVVTAGIPLDTLLRGADITNPSVAVDFRVYDGYARTVGAASSLFALNSDTIASISTKSWVQTIGRGLNMVRVEAMQRDIGRAVRATLTAAADTSIGFGLSDVLLTNSAKSEVFNATSWRTLGLKPSNGIYRSGSKIGIVWEIYELAAQQESNRYRVAITVARTKRKGAAAFAIRLLDRVGDVVRQSDAKSDKVILSFDRTARDLKTQVEFISLDGIGDYAGDFSLRIEVTDLFTERTSVRETSFRVR